MFGLFRRLRRRRLLKQPFPPPWRELLEKRVPFYSVLPPDLGQSFRDKLKLFVWEKRFVGANELTITDEHRVLVAAGATRLIVGLDYDYYNRLKEIVVYPTDIVHPEKKGVVVYGQANRFGTVVLSWPAVLRGMKRPEDGRDTTVHEFAHVLDVADGYFDGRPPLRQVAHVRPWADVMTRHFESLKARRTNRGLIRKYGAQNAPEFFAVATEVFFERPETLQDKKPELYAELKQFYGWDPIVGERLTVATRLRRRRRSKRRK